MKLVADANILFSIAKPDSAANDIMERYALRLYSPDYVLSELKEHRGELEKKTGIPFGEIILSLKEKITFIETAAYRHLLKKALNNLKDPEDALYLALALTLKCPVWSNDRHLKDQKLVPALTTKELIEILGAPWS
ncbi:MAG: PIN domain-containing protein [Candidatus Altiarchaeota archaeon]|nr:PIN domain-containing protein [Candidatus Altiarchaeota archaeon]